jgi:tetratricopeptide (TPR) repeat protein
VPIVLFTLAAYLPAILGGFIWDDDDYVVNNTALLNLDGLRRIWFELGATRQYYPMVFTSFWLERHLWGLDPQGYHAVNVLLHALAAILLGRVLSRLQVPGAWLAAAIFALHPVHVESVAWITERKNVLSAVFYFAAALAYLRFVGQTSCLPVEAASCSRENEAAMPGDVARASRPSTRKQTGETPVPLPLGEGEAHGEEEDGAGMPREPSGWKPDPRRWYLAALLLFVCALLSKTVTCSLPAALLLVFWWRKGRLDKATVLPTLPFFGIGVVFGLLTSWMEKHSVGAQGAEWSLTFLERCLVAGRALWFYALKLVWPSGLTFIYPRWEIDTGVWWQWVFPVASVAMVVVLWRARHRLGRGPLVAALFFWGTLFPALGFVDVYPMRYSFVADHFQYLASVGLIALGAAALYRLCNRSRRGDEADGSKLSTLNPQLSTLLWLLPVVLGVLTWQQAGIYRNAEGLWRDTLAKNPTCGMAHNNLGLLLADQGKKEEAESHYRRALEIDPDHQEALNNLGLIFIRKGLVSEAADRFRRALQLRPNDPKALVNMGNVLLTQGRVDEAMQHFDKSLRIDSYSPEAWVNMGTALAGQKRYTEAISYFKMAARLEPNNADNEINLGDALIELGNPDEAAIHLSRAVQQNPGDAKAHGDLARALAMQGKYAEAMARYTEAMRLSPKDPSIRYNSGVVLGLMGRTKEAIEQYRLALEYKPDYPEAYNNLGVALTVEGRENEAIAFYTEALRLKPDYAEAHNNLAYVLAKLGRRDEAIAHLNEAIRLKPDYEQARKQLRELGGQLPN